MQPNRITADYDDGTCWVKGSAFFRAVKAFDIQQVRTLILASKDRKELVNSEYYYDDKDCYGDFDRETSLTAAIRNGNLEIVKLIVENGGDVAQWWSAQGHDDYFYDSPMDLAIEGGCQEIIDYLESRISN